MLFGYPIESTAENWFHDCLIEMLSAIHSRLDNGQAPPNWPDFIPAAHRDKLAARNGLRDRIANYGAAYVELPVPERDRVKVCVHQQNRIGELCGCVEDCDDLNRLHESIRGPIRELFGFAFGLLTKLGIRDRHYEKIYNSIDYQVCPFCGCECFDAPGAPREDLDHYLPKSRYPFAAANLCNLAPMGMKCNQRYKLDQDILVDAGGERRRAFDPYANHSIAICLNDSAPFEGDNRKTPAWQVSFIPDSPECETWDQVFKVRERIKRDVLDPSFQRWLSEFAAWSRRRTKDTEPNGATIPELLFAYAEDIALLGLGAREFLRVPMFRMIYHHCSEGHPRLEALVADLLSESGEI